MARVLIGIGNPDRGDDAAGWAVADRVTGWDVERRQGGSFDVLELWGPDDEVVIVDAMRSESAPGTVMRFDAADGLLPSGTFSSTHSFGPAAVVELARMLDRLPESLIVIGIEADDMGMGNELSPAVEHAVDAVAKELQHA